MGGGCSGLSYSIKFDTQPRERDRIFDFDGVRVFVDPKSFFYLHGMTLDYEETLMRQGFNFINPNSTRSCGCGSSFSDPSLFAASPQRLIVLHCSLAILEMSIV